MELQHIQDVLLNDRWSWGVARKFSKGYGMQLSDKEIMSDLGFLFSKILYRRRQRKVIFRNENDWIKYFRLSLKNKYCTVSMKHKRRNAPLVPFDILHEMKSRVDIQKEIEDENRHYIAVRGARTILSVVKRKKIHNVKGVYDEFGIKGLRVLVKCGFFGNVVLIQRKEEDEMITRNIEKWLKHLGFDRDKGQSSLDKLDCSDAFREYISKAWLENDKYPDVFDDPDDCFGVVYSPQQAICKGCKIWEECKIALESHVVVGVGVMEQSIEKTEEVNHVEEEALGEIEKEAGDDNVAEEETPEEPKEVAVVEQEEKTEEVPEKKEKVVLPSDTTIDIELSLSRMGIKCSEWKEGWGRYVPKVGRVRNRKDGNISIITVTKKGKEITERFGGIFGMEVKKWKTTTNIIISPTNFRTVVEFCIGK